MMVGKGMVSSAESSNYFDGNMVFVACLYFQRGPLEDFMIDVALAEKLTVN